MPDLVKLPLPEVTEFRPGVPSDPGWYLACGPEGNVAEVRLYDDGTVHSSAWDRGLRVHARVLEQWRWCGPLDVEEGW